MGGIRLLRMDRLQGMNRLLEMDRLQGMNRLLEMDILQGMNMMTKNGHITWDDRLLGILTDYNGWIDY